MDKQLDIRFDRVEKALGTLVDSIAKYNPSTHSAHDFVAADAELGKGLEELQTHQSNYRRLQELRAASASLDAQIKDTLRLLANTRKELVNTPATIFPEGSHYPINYDELLSYARMISPTTIPPVGAINGLPAHSEPQGNLDAGGTETAATTPGGPGAATPVGGGATPNGLQNGTASQASSQPPADQPGPAPPAPQAQQSQQTVASAGTAATSTTLPEHLSVHLNPHAQTEFAPWPGEDKVRQGSLAALAFLAERGVDPEGYDPEEEAERARRRKAEEEEERRRREDEEDRARRLRHEEQLRQRAAAQAAREREAAEEAEAWRRSSVGGAQPSASSPVGGEKRQFQFMGDLDDDDD